MKRRLTIHNADVVIDAYNYTSGECLQGPLGAILQIVSERGYENDHWRFKVKK